MNETFSVTFDEDYLSHHGILKQKWGHRNGPPYPLSKSAYSAAEKKANGVTSRASSPKFSSAKLNKPEPKKGIKINSSKGVDLKELAQPSKGKLDIDTLHRGTIAINNTINAAKVLNNNVDKMIPKKENKEDLSRMSDQELKAKLNRLNMEKQYNQLTSKDTTRGTEYVREALEIAGGVAGLTLAGIEVARFIKGK